ncbi:MAG: LuxR family transcriptional regulator, partial [Elusimicrobia bacterium]
MERQGVALLNGRLYGVGGVKGGAPTAEVWSAGVSPAGTLGAWRREADLPAPRESHGLAAFGGRLYVVGGFDGSAKSTVYSAEVSPDGRIAGWNTDSSLPAARSKLALVAHAGWLY